MLEPQDRRQLLESLRPPDGCTLDFALGTTYSLDLLALLTAPLAFTFFDWEDEEGKPTADPQALLAAIRRNADRMAIFCQAGQIAVPREHQQLFNYLENAVFEVSPDHTDGVFHAKIWLLRYTAPDQPVRYRFLCLSRNLTFDRSWDTVLVLDGSLQDRKRPFAKNRPLCDFIEALAKLALRPVPERVTKMVATIQEEVPKVEFELPLGFNEVRFWPLGIKGSKKWPFEDGIDRLLVMSPFVSASCLNQFDNERKNNILISRVDSLEELTPKCLGKFKDVYCLNSGAEPEPDDSDDGADHADSALVGLHAKLYVADRGWDASVYTGSANATNAAFERNVEFLTELVGLKSRCGIDVLLEPEKGQTKLIDLLEPFPVGKAPAESDEILKRLEQKIQDATRVISQARLEARVEVGAEPGQFGVSLVRGSDKPLALPASTKARCWPVSLPESAGTALGTGGPAARFEPLSMLALTSFYAFTVQASAEGRIWEHRFVLNLPLLNAPETRNECVLRSLLGNREQVMKLLLLLLFEEQAGEAEGSLLVKSLVGGGAGGGAGPVPLFETLMRTLDRAPRRIVDVARIVTDLRKTPEGQALLPEGFDRIWEPIHAALEKMQP